MGESKHSPRSIFLDAIEIDNPHERAEFVERACAGNGAFLREVKELLAASMKSGSFLADRPSQTPGIEQPGDRIGRYKLLQRIGEGGCGVVYMAEQEEPVRRKVALKVIKLGMDTRQVIARFEAERQALALMDHPSIARVLDAGAAESGRPFFVMELVRGVKITDYCDQQELPIRERLELFVAVCQAVQHAHQKGVIHRDIKPSNILVTVNDGTPVPKVIDFGIAKATEGRLTDQTLFTAFDQFLGTPAYMSPEQTAMTNVDIDTRSDIYSLGVLLYELLTGSTPFDTGELLARGLDELRRTIREKEPMRPSTRLAQLSAPPRRFQPANHFVRGDLDWIVMKCLEKERGRRYETANGLALDIQRHLANEPIVARSPSHFYRLQKLVQRHKLLCTASVVVAAILLLGILSSTFLYFREARARADAQLSAAQARRAEADATEKLGASYLAQAQAIRWSGRPGRRFESLKLLQKAAAIHPSLEIRNQAIACLALFDVRPVRELKAESDAFDVRGGMDAGYTRHAYADAGGVVHVRRTDNDADLAQLTGYGPPFWALDLSPNGRLLFICCGVNQDRAELQDWATGSVLFRQSQARFRAASFSPDNQYLALAYNDETKGRPIEIIDLRQNREVARFAHDTLPYYMRFNPCRTNLLLTSDATSAVRLWDWPSGRLLHVLDHPGGVLGICWSPDGMTLATACQDGKTRQWDAEGTQPIATYSGHDREVTQVEFSHEGQFLASAGWDGKLCFWPTADPREMLGMAAPGALFPFADHDQRVAFQFDSEKLQVVELCGASGFRELSTDSADDRPGSCTFSPDGHRLLVAHAHGMSLWNMSTAARIWRRQWTGEENGAILHPLTGCLLVGTTGGIEEWSLHEEPGQVKPVWQGRKSFHRTSDPFFVSNDGKILAYADGGDAFVVNQNSGEEMMRTSRRHYDFAVPSPDRRWLAAWTRMNPDGTPGTNVDIWGIGTSNLTKVIAATPSIQAAFSPDNRCLAVGDAAQFCLWETRSWTFLRKISREFAGHYGYLAFSPDSAVLAVAASRNMVRLLDAATGRELATLEPPHPAEIAGITFNPNGDQLAVLCSSGAVQLWDIPQIRHQLAAMNLNWDLPSNPSEKAAAGGL